MAVGWASSAATSLLLSAVGFAACGGAREASPSMSSVGAWHPLSPGTPPRVAPDLSPPIIGVWSGRSLLVWGRTAYCPDGGNAAGFCPTGASYDPSADQWASVSLIGGPAARDLSSGTWIGSGLLVWGGEGCGTLLGACTDGSVYDPSSDSWSSIAGPAPIASRGQHTAVWNGSVLMVFGGVALPRASGSLVTLGDGATYDPASHQWSAMSSAGGPSSRYWHSAIWTGRQMIVWGGSHDGTNPLGDGATYDPAADTWTPLPTENAPLARYLHSAVWTGVEMIVWAGLGCTRDARGVLPCSDGGAYNPGTGRWRRLATAGAPRPSNGAQAVWTGSKMLVWGGEDSAGGAAYDPQTDAWTAMTTAGQPSPRSGQVALWTGSELLVWGGLVGEGTTLDGGLFVLSP